MSRYRSNTSPELLTILKRWQQERQLADAERLADEMPHVLEDVARVKQGFLTLQEKVKALEKEMNTYRQTRILTDFDDDQMH